MYYLHHDATSIPVTGCSPQSLAERQESEKQSHLQQEAQIHSSRYQKKKKNANTQPQTIAKCYEAGTAILSLNRDAEGPGKCWLGQ